MPVPVLVYRSQVRATLAVSHREKAAAIIRLLQEKSQTRARELKLPVLVHVMVHVSAAIFAQVVCKWQTRTEGPLGGSESQWTGSGRLGC